MNDTFAAGVEPGGLRTSQEIKILICYLLRTVEQPMLRDDVTDILVGNGMANYFDIEEAMEELLRLQHLVQSDDRRIATTVSGAQIGDELSVRIPYTLRERSVKAALRLLRRRSIEKDNMVTVDRSPDGARLVTCAVQDCGKTLFSVTLRVADAHQEETVRENFLNDPTLLYRSALAVLTGDAGLRRAGSQIVIDL